MTSDFRGDGGGSKITRRNRTLKGMNRTLGGEEGVKNGPKKSDIIHGRYPESKINQFELK